jgi:hypothetical protein
MLRAMNAVIILDGVSTLVSIGWVCHLARFHIGVDGHSITKRTKFSAHTTIDTRECNFSEATITIRSLAFKTADLSLLINSN